MATTTPQQALPIPDETDKPDVPTHISNLALALEKKLVGTYVSTAARDTAITTPADGQFAYIQSTNKLYVYQDGAWTVFPPTQVSITSGTAVPTNSSGNDGDVFFKV